MENLNNSENNLLASENPTKPTLKKMEQKHNRFLNILRDKAGNVTEACKGFKKINRTTFYDWCKTIDGFQNEVDAIQESLIDYTESMLMRKITEGDTTAILFKLKCHARKRGYIDRQEHEITGKLKIEQITGMEII